MTYPFRDWHGCVGERIWYRDTFLLNNFTLTLSDQVVFVFCCIVKRSHPKFSHPWTMPLLMYGCIYWVPPQIVQWRNATTTCEHMAFFWAFSVPQNTSIEFRRARGWRLKNLTLYSLCFEALSCFKRKKDKQTKNTEILSFAMINVGFPLNLILLSKLRTMIHFKATTL